MLRKSEIGMIFLIIGLVLLLIPTSLTITGNVTAENSQIDFSYFYIIGIILLFASIIIFANQKSSNAITVPTETKALPSEDDAFVKTA